MPGMVNLPSARVTAAYAVPDGPCTATTRAASSGAPEESVTTPAIAAVVTPWAPSAVVPAKPTAARSREISHGGFADALDAAVHIVGAVAPHHSVFARADRGGQGVLAHIPLLLPPAPGVAFRRLGQLCVRKFRAPQSQEDAQATLKVVELDGHVTPHCPALRGAKVERVPEIL